MIRKLATLSLFLISGLAAAEPKAWVQESDQNTKVLLEVLARFAPETASSLGVDGFDDQVLDLKPKTYERGQDATRAAMKELNRRLEKTTDPAVRQDLQILIQSCVDNLHSNELQNDLLLPYFAVSRIVFGGMRALLDPQVPKERQAIAVMRLKRYAGMDGQSKPITQLARERTEEQFGNKKLLWPFKGEIEQNLSDTPQLIEGLKQLFKGSGLDGYQDALAAIEKQLVDYDTWTRDTLLPKARADSRLPPEIYADNLKQFGVDIAPEQLIQRALIGFVEIQNEMKAIAPLVAKQKGFKSSDYHDVIRELKKKQVIGKAILPLYTGRLAEIEKIIRREGIVTLPDRKARIRLASEAETAMQPAPNMRPPRLIGNTGEYGEFILPLVMPAKEGRAALRMDDFTHDAGTWSLTAHEARPGHELQFSAMVEKGVSQARAIFAFNSVNIEGWGLYSEAEVKPYLPLDGQLLGLQFRLQRAARMFLDPMVNLGQMTPEQAKAFMMNEVVMSEGMSQQEADRYSFRAPGQATSYYYGYQRLMETRERAQLALGAKFDRKAFNDFVLSQGLLPPRLLEKAVMEEFVPAQSKG